MFGFMRHSFGPLAIGLIIGAISLTFVLTGVFDVLGSRFGGSGSYAAMVNGDTVSLTDFNREYQQRMEYFQSMMKGKMDPKMLQKMGFERQVLEDLIRRQLLLQQADKMGFKVSDEELRDKIQVLPYFQKDGHFDATYYKRLLTANGMQPAAFEERIREDLMRAKFVEMVHGLAKVSNTEVHEAFLVSEDKRSVPYIFIGLDHFAPKMPKIDPKAADKTKAPSVNQEELAKKAHDAAEALYAQVKGLSADKARAVAKAKGFELKSSEPFNRMSPIPGVGYVPDLTKDAFDASSVLTKGAKMYETRGSYVIAFAPSVHAPDLSKFDADKDKLIETLEDRKQQAILEDWMNDVRQRAKVKVNSALSRQES